MNHEFQASRECFCLIATCTLMLVMLLQHAMAQSVTTDHADPVIQAAELVEHARVLRTGCDYPGAERWLRRAHSLVRDARMRTGEADAAGNLAARIEIEIAGLRDLRLHLDREQQAISRMIEQKQLAAARQRLRQAVFPACETRAEGLKQQIAEAQYRLDHPKHCDSCRKVAKVLVWTAVVGGVGYGGWIAYDKFGRQAPPGSVPRSPRR